uniref:Transposase n=1 Tax=Romanomermis culicivorax TaxID=13658 RepID=A0A915HFB6_ROMCU
MKRRNDYIVKIRQYPSENRKIFHQDETWLNASHIPAKAWVDTNVEENPYDALNPNFKITLGYIDP